MSILGFLRDNLRWIAGGFLLTFFSSFGQTFFISLSAGDVRAEYGLSHGQFGLIYMGATLASALTLPRLGQTVDTQTIRRVSIWTVGLLTIACVLMALSQHVLLLALTVYMLRLFGQGMMTHIAFTAIGRWFSAQRGRALSLSTIGLNAGEGVLPIAFVGLAALFGWRGAWLVAAVVLLLLALPAIAALVATERSASAADPVGRPAAVRDWTRREAFRDPYLWLLLAGVLSHPLIATCVFFHQVHLVGLKGWPIEFFAASFGVSAVVTIAAALVTGQLIDRFSAVRILPIFLLPLGIGCMVLALASGEWAIPAFMALFGLSNGITMMLYGALWPEVYGTAHLGGIRAAVVAMIVLSTALGPGLSGLLIDAGIAFPSQIFVLGLYCLAAIPVMLVVSRRVTARLAADRLASASAAGYPASP